MFLCSVTPVTLGPWGMVLTIWISVHVASSLLTPLFKDESILSRHNFKPPWFYEPQLWDFKILIPILREICLISFGPYFYLVPPNIWLNTPVGPRSFVPELLVGPNHRFCFIYLINGSIFWPGTSKYFTEYRRCVKDITPSVSGVPWSQILLYLFNKWSFIIDRMCGLLTGHK
jgi:hypothetical protein